MYSNFKKAITQIFTEYLRRAMEIRIVLDDDGPGPASNGDAAAVTSLKTKPEDGEGGDGEDPEQTKLRAGLNLPGFGMKISKTEVNLRRLLAAAPQQQNQAKLSHYVATLREQVEQLAEERTPEGLPRVSKAVLSDYSEKIEAIASKLAAPLPDLQEPQESLARISVKAKSSETGDNQSPHSPGLRRRFVPNSNIQDGTRETPSADSLSPVKLDAAAQAHIEKHRRLQEDLTDEMVGLARQLKETSLMMSHSVQNTEKLLDSTEEAVERSLASTGHATARASDIYSKTSKTSCFTWLLMFLMTCIFIMVVLLIRVT